LEIATSGMVFDGDSRVRVRECVLRFCQGRAHHLGERCRPGYRLFAFVNHGSGRAQNVVGRDSPLLTGEHIAARRPPYRFQDAFPHPAHDARQCQCRHAEGQFRRAVARLHHHANDQLLSADAYKGLVIAYRNGSPVRLTDVTDVIDGAQNTKLAAWMNRVPDSAAP
jgi:hypothetical protein